VVSVVVIACLYWAHAVFVPLAMAVFLAFLLAPVVSFLQRRGLRRTPAVILVVLLAALVLSGGIWLVAAEVTSLVRGLPDYTKNIKQKFDALNVGPESLLGRLDKMIQDIAPKVKPQAGDAKDPADKPASPTPGAPPAVVLQQSPGWAEGLPAVLYYFVETLAGLVLVLVLVIFMLLKREDLRNRIIRLVGHGRLTLTTKAVEDAGQRIARFLLMQAIVNSAFGTILGFGLLLIGVEHALLWGFLATLLRYIPYIGAWIAIMPPIVFSLAMFNGWVKPLEVIGLFLVLELVTSNVFEPRLYAQRLGVSEVALLLATAFWGFLWGPVGLVLASPLTVCLVVLGKYARQLEFLDVLLGDAPALDPDISYYQRLLARDQDEATQLVVAQTGSSSPEQVYDDLLIPALNYARRDREREDLTEADEQFVLQATREILEDLGEGLAAVAEKVAQPAEKASATAAPLRIGILGCPGHGETDGLALEMFRQLLDPARWNVELLSIEMLSAEMVALAGTKDPAVICIAALPPGGLAHTRYLCKRLRARLPAARIVVGRWGLRGNVEQNEEQLRDTGADAVETTLLGTREHLNAWLPALAHDEEKTAGGAHAMGQLVAV
jgi:predicted PurR-regulated permease PerM